MRQLDGDDVFDNRGYVLPKEGDVDGSIHIFRSLEQQQNTIAYRNKAVIVVTLWNEKFLRHIGRFQNRVGYNVFLSRGDHLAVQ